MAVWWGLNCPEGLLSPLLLPWASTLQTGLPTPPQSRTFPRVWSLAFQSTDSLLLLLLLLLQVASVVSILQYLIHQMRIWFRSCCTLFIVLLFFTLLMFLSPVTVNQEKQVLSFRRLKAICPGSPEVLRFYPLRMNRSFLNCSHSSIAVTWARFTPQAQQAPFQVGLPWLENFKG